MALDTTIGGTGADSYGTLAAYEAYVVANIASDYTGTAQELSLRRAAQYLDRKYKFIGQQQHQFQARAWPRLTDDLVDGWPIDPDTIPLAIIEAQFEVAYQLEVDGLNPLATDTDGAVKTTMLKAGSVSESIEYLSPRTTPRIIAVEGLLRDYATGGGAGQVRLGRG